VLRAVRDYIRAKTRTRRESMPRLPLRLLLAACLCSGARAAPPCPSNVPARDCYALETLLGTPDHILEHFDNDHAAADRFLRHFAQDPDTSGAPLETTLQFPSVGTATVFLTNWFLEPRYFEMQRTRPAHAPPEDAEHLAWLSGHGPRRLHEPHVFLRDDLSAAQRADVADNRAVYLRFRSFFGGSVPPGAVVTAAACQAALDASPAFADTVRAALRAAADLDAARRGGPPKPPLRIAFRCAAVRVRRTESLAERLVPSSLSAFNYTRERGRSHAQTQADIYVALYSDNCLWDGGNFQPALYAGLPAAVPGPDALFQVYAARMGSILGTPRVAVEPGGGVQVRRALPPVTAEQGAAAGFQLQALTQRLAHTRALLGAPGRVRELLQRGFASVRGRRSAVERYEVFEEDGGVYLRTSAVAGVRWPEHEDNYDCSLPPCPRREPAWSRACPRGFQPSAELVLCDNGACFQPACMPCAMHFFERPPPPEDASAAVPRASLPWTALRAALTQGVRQDVVLYKRQAVTLSLQQLGEPAHSAGAVFEAEVNRRAADPTLYLSAPHGPGEEWLVNLTRAAALDDAFRIPWEAGGRAALRVWFLDFPRAPRAAECAPCPPGTFTDQVGAESAAACQSPPAAVRAGLSDPQLAFLYATRDNICNATSPSEAIEASAVGADAAGAAWEITVYQREPRDSAPPTLPAGPDGMRVVHTRSAILPDFDASLVQLLRRDPPPAAAVRRRALLSAASAGVMHAYGPAAPLQPPPPSQTERGSHVVWYVLASIAGAGAVYAAAFCRCSAATPAIPFVPLATEAEHIPHAHPAGYPDPHRGAARYHPPAYAGHAAMR